MRGSHSKGDLPHVTSPVGPPPACKQALNLLWVWQSGLKLNKNTHYGGELHVAYICQLLALPVKEKSVW